VTLTGTVAAGLVVVIAAGLLQLSRAWWHDAAPVDPAAPQARTYTEETVRVFLSSGPDGPSAAAEAALYEAAGHPDLALLLYRDAARRGAPEAALAIGRMYDPEGFAPGRSAFAAPDAEQAAAYYDQAAQAGEPEAQYRLGRLLLSGRTSGDADAERGAVWLQRAAEQGHAEARAALDRLQERVP
jgi:TPR repeat protein